MRLDLTEILREVGKRLPYDIHEPPFVDEHLECMQPIEGNIIFTNTGGILLIQGRAVTALALRCSRCDTYFEWPVSLHIDEQFELRHISAGPRTMAGVAVVEEDVNPIAGKLFDGQVFDLTEMLRQYLLLAEPAQPQPPVKPDGACAKCDRRPEEVLLSACPKPEAGETPVNPGFARLQELLEQKKSSE